jgi:phage terminase large subunit-like protein
MAELTDRQRAEVEKNNAAAWAIQWDAEHGGKRYKSEVSSCARLFEIFTTATDDEKKGTKCFLKAENEAKRVGKESDLEISTSLKSTSEQIGKGTGIDCSFLNPILGNRRVFQEWLELRDRARKNLFWLGSTVLKRDLLPHVHQIVCDQFVTKNFDGVYYEGYKIRDVHNAIGRQERFDNHGNPTREMMLLDPRGFFKTTIDGIDCVQWLLNAPDIRILILAQEDMLSHSFLGGIKSYFNRPKSSHPTDFHLLFPEYVLTGLDGRSDQPLWCPVRIHNQNEPSLWTNSITSALSGWHCDIRKADDVVGDRNCVNFRGKQSELKMKFDGTDNLVDEWGLSDYIGTRYFPDDWYGLRIEDSDNIDTSLKYFCRQCWTVKPEYEGKVKLQELTEQMVILNFPEKATFGSLHRKLMLNEKSFRNQQLNEPIEDDTGITINFDPEMLNRHCIRLEQASTVGDVYIIWDTALTANKRSDFSAGAVGRIVAEEVKDQNGAVVETRYKLVILEVVYDRFSQSELAIQIVALAKKWRPKKTLIERLPGSELFQREVAMRATQHGVSMDIYFYPPSLEPNAKRNRIHSLEILLKEDRLFFVSGPWINETFYQLRRYTGQKKNRGRKDDIPDAMASLVMFLPATVQNDVLKELHKREQEAAKQKAVYDRIFGVTTMPSQAPSPSSSMGKPNNRGAYGIPGFRPPANRPKE